MNLPEYALSGQKKYAEFADIVAAILDAAICAQDPKFRYQHIQRRAKAVKSLRDKLIDRGQLDSNSVEDVIKDLAGCRVVFLSNADVERFSNSGILRENFEIDRKRTKPHYPVPNSSGAEDQFRSHNIVVKLSEQRAKLPEYAPYAGLFCEVQVQTILDHAWSETAHDITYKRPKVPGIGKRLLESMDVRLKKIMLDYLAPAGHQFQKVLNDYDKFLSAKKLLEGRAVDKLLTATDNNDRNKTLEGIRDFLLPSLDDPNVQYPPILEKMVQSFEIANSTPAVPWILPGGFEIEGTTQSTYLKTVVGVLEQYRYANVAGTFQACCTLYVAAETKSDKDAIAAVARRLAKYDRLAWNQVGPRIQAVLLESIQKLPADQIAALSPLVILVLEEIISPALEGVTATFDSINIQMGAVVPTPALERLRADALTLLFERFHAAASDSEKRTILNAIEHASRTPHLGTYPPKLLALILSDTKRTVEFFCETGASESIEILAAMERKVLWFMTFVRSIPQSSFAEADFKTEIQGLNQSIAQFRVICTAIKDFESFKTVVGHESVLAPDWDDPNFLMVKEEYRKQKIDEYVAAIGDGDFEHPHAFIRRCASSIAADRSQGNYLWYLLERIGLTNPKLALTLIAADYPELADLGHHLLRGMDQGSSKDQARELAENWVINRKKLRSVAIYLRSTQPLNINLLSRVLHEAISQSDLDCVVLCLMAVVERRGQDCEPECLKIFGSALDALTNHQVTYWVESTWFIRPESSLICVGDRDASEKILRNLITAPKIGYHEESILSEIAGRFPEQVIDCLAQRIIDEDSKHKDTDFDPLPFDLRSLHKKLDGSIDYIFTEASKLHRNGDVRVRDRAVWLLHSAYPDLPTALQNKLLEYAKRDREGLLFALALLRAFDGDTVVHDLCKEFVELLPVDDELLDEIGIILWSMGVVSGPFGFVDGLRSKITDMEGWLSDTRVKVRKFAEGAIASYEKEMALEQKRAEHDLELRKLDWGTPAADDE